MSFQKMPKNKQRWIRGAECRGANLCLFRRCLKTSRGASASKLGPSNQPVNLDLPPPRPRSTSHSVEAIEVDYGPALPPHLGADHHYTSD